MILYYLTILINQYDLDKKSPFNEYFYLNSESLILMMYCFNNLINTRWTSGYDEKISKKGEESVGEDESVRA
jgi:hypothetical protein